MSSELLARWSPLRQRRAVYTREVSLAFRASATPLRLALSSDTLVLATSAMLSSTVHSDDGLRLPPRLLRDDRLFSWEGERFSRNAGWPLFLQGWTA